MTVECDLDGTEEHRTENTVADFFFKFLCQASEEASLRALESLMTEFFHDCTTNERKREIGKWSVEL